MRSVNVPGVIVAAALLLLAGLWIWGRAGMRRRRAEARSRTADFNRTYVWESEGAPWP